MMQEETRIVPAETFTPGDAEAIEYLRKEVAGGKHWYTALLGAIGLWTSAEESYNGRSNVYLIDGEAFDWLLLAERLSDTISGFIPEHERDALLFHGMPPLKLATPEVKELIGDKKYGMYLNYFYGIIVEEALTMAVQEEVDKERHVQGLGKRGRSSGETYRRIYGTDKETLLNQFRAEKGIAGHSSTTLGEIKQFNYWLFKYRLKHCEKARIASDTRKALDYLKRVWELKGAAGLLAADLAPIILP